MFNFNTSRRHTCVIEITEMLSYKDNRYNSQEVFLPLLCFLELEAALTVLSLSGIKKRPLMGGWLNTTSAVISIGATASVHYREVVRSCEGRSIMGGTTVYWQHDWIYVTWWTMWELTPPTPICCPGRCNHQLHLQQPKPRLQGSHQLARHHPHLNRARVKPSLNISVGLTVKCVKHGIL